MNGIGETSRTSSCSRGEAGRAEGRERWREGESVGRRICEVGEENHHNVIRVITATLLTGSPCKHHHQMAAFA